jgi:hypothetical protein
MSTYEKFTLALQVITILVAAFTLGAYYWQLRVMSKQLMAMQQASNAQSGLSLVNFLQAPDVREACGWSIAYKAPPRMTFSARRMT